MERDESDGAVKVPGNHTWSNIYVNDRSERTSSKIEVNKLRHSARLLTDSIILRLGARRVSRAKSK